MINTDKYRENFRPYITKAFLSIPYIDKPSILDIGCGSGVPTIILAEISNGIITAIDIDKECLEILNEKIHKSGLEKRIITQKCSMLNMPFPPNSFDIIWAEGSITMIGFKKGISKCRAFLKQGGYLVVHDDESNIKRKIDDISKSGYKLLKQLFISEKAWWQEYFAHLEKEINERYLVHDKKPKGKDRRINDEIIMYRKNPDRFNSVYFIMKKISD